MRCVQTQISVKKKKKNLLGWGGVKKNTKRKDKTHLKPGEGGREHADVLRVRADGDEYKERTKKNKRKYVGIMGWGWGHVAC